MNTFTSVRFVLILSAAFLLFAAMPMLAQGNAPWTPPRPSVPVVTQPITAAETEALVFMREEEKLARDVYQVLGRKWNVRTFSSIMESEQRHTDAIKVLLDRYGLPDPSAGLGAGQFANTELQALYDALVADGLVSLRAAAQVGKLIEVTDIADIDTRLAQVPAGSDIAVVYGNLRLGSESHLAAFTTLLQRVR